VVVDINVTEITERGVGLQRPGGRPMAESSGFDAVCGEQELEQPGDIT
jgi:hypothetical protein